MQDDKAKTESELTKFFTGLDVGLNSLREVRTAYDEQIAFDFNMLRFFKPRETKISEILAFFLDPKNNHGQKYAFLRTFLEHFKLSDNLNTLLSADEQITVGREDSTETNRKIDVTVSFKNANFMIGIENKVYAVDRQSQVQAYCKELHKRTDGNYVLLYLSLDRHEPSETSIPKDELQALLLSKKIQIASHSEIAEVLKKYETVCRADNVRGFIRQFQQYIKQEHLGESFMGETDFLVNYIRANPKIVKHADALWRAVQSLKPECFNEFWRTVAKHLEDKSIHINLARMQWRTSSFSQAAVEHPGSPFGGPSELNKPEVFYEPNEVIPVYIAIGLPMGRNGLSPMLKGKVERFEENLRAFFKDLYAPPDLWHWCAVVPLPHPRFNEGDTICEFLKGGSKMQVDAVEAAKKISEYIGVAEKVWREMQQQ
jgi:hypothetical protein